MAAAIKLTAGGVRNPSSGASVTLISAITTSHTYSTGMPTLVALTSHNIELKVKTRVKAYRVSINKVKSGKDNIMYRTKINRTINL